LGHSNDFLTVGSMGHSSSIALGIALNVPNRNIFCFDGDGALLMHMGSIATIGSFSPKNFRHIVFNNGAHESVGGQPTIGFNLDLEKIALGSGYKKYFLATTQDEITTAMKRLADFSDLALLEIRINLNSRDDLGRPTVIPIDNKRDLMKTIQNN
jgi:phosphonopyruvate decarboxylase